MQVLVLGYVDTKGHGADTLLFCFIGFHQFFYYIPMSFRANFSEPVLQRVLNYNLFPLSWDV